MSLRRTQILIEFLSFIDELELPDAVCRIAQWAYERGKRDGENKWISCEERMPSIEEAVLVAFENDIFTANLITPGGLLKWYLSYHHSEEVIEISDITHWMPLPSLPGDKNE